MAQRQVQAQGDQCTLAVVADGGIGRVFVLPVVFHPGIKTGLCHRLHLAPRRLQHLVDGFAQQLEVGRVVDQASPAQQQFVVVAGKALKEPEQLGVVFLAVVISGQFCRAQLFDVPGVEILMADQTQQGGVALAQCHDRP